MKTISNRDMVFDFLKGELRLHHSDDFRGICFFADDDARGQVTKKGVTAAVGYNSFIGRIAQIHIVIQKPEKFTRQMIRTIFEYAFVQCGLSAVVALVDSSNYASIALVERTGFQLATEVEDGGLDEDLIFYVMKKNQCYWLRSNHGMEERTACA